MYAACIFGAASRLFGHITTVCLSVAKSISTFRLRLDDEDVNYYSQGSIRPGRSPLALEFWDESEEFGVTPVELSRIRRRDWLCQLARERDILRAAVAFMIIMSLHKLRRELVFTLNHDIES